MKAKFKKDVYIRLAEDRTSFSYTVKYGWLVAVTREVRLDGGSEAAAAVRTKASARRQS